MERSTDRWKERLTGASMHRSHDKSTDRLSAIDAHERTGTALGRWRYCTTRSRGGRSSCRTRTSCSTPSEAISSTDNTQQAMRTGQAKCSRLVLHLARCPLPRHRQRATWTGIMQHATRTILYASCCMHHAACSMQHAACNGQRATRSSANATPVTLHTCMHLAALLHGAVPNGVQCGRLPPGH